MVVVFEFLIEVVLVVVVMVGHYKNIEEGKINVISIISFVVIALALVARLVYSLATLLKDQDPVLARYQTNQLRLMVTCILDALLINKFCAFIVVKKTAESRFIPPVSDYPTVYLSHNQYFLVLRPS